MAKRVSVNAVSEEEALARIRAHYKVDERRARFILALMRGDIQGDIEMPGDRRRQKPVTPKNPAAPE